MPLLNHTTTITIPLARTLAEIAKAVPVPITFEHEHGRVSAVAFRYAGELYRLSPNVEGCWKLLAERKGLAKAQRTYAHAERVAWRCLLSWVKAELALVAMDQAALRTRPGVSEDVLGDRGAGVGAEAGDARLGGTVGIDCDGHNHKKQEAETMNTNTPKSETGVDPLTEDELKEGALEIAEWLRKLPPDEQRQMLAEFEQHIISECPTNLQPASEALRRYLVRACLH